MAEDIVNNRAVLATSPDAGTVVGQVPLIATVDSAAGVACTSTELGADVEFYTAARRSSTGVVVPAGA